MRDIEKNKQACKDADYIFNYFSMVKVEENKYSSITYVSQFTPEPVIRINTIKYLKTLREQFSIWENKYSFLDFFTYFYNL